MKRLRTPKLQDGELRMYWGRECRGSVPEIMFAWQGDRGMKHDANLLHYMMCSKRPDLTATPLFSVMQPSLIEELDARGYDLTTLKFSIKKKATHGISGETE